MQRLVMHVDMDAFFASVEQRDNPEYRGKPIIVGGLSARGVVATASYEARKFGVHSAMPMSQARRLCPQGIFLRGRYDQYEAVSNEIFEIFLQFSPQVEPLSIDEAFLDITGMGRLMKNPREYAERLKAAIKEKTGLVASVGIAPNKFLAKIASDWEKPNGLFVIEPDAMDDFLRPLPVRKIWGVGKKTAERLETLGIKTAEDLRQFDSHKLQQVLGSVKLARHLTDLASGIDNRPVEAIREAQSIGRETTFETDIFGFEAAEQALLHLAGEVGWRLRRAGKKAQTVQIKVRTAEFVTCTRQRTLTAPICYDEDIFRVARDLYKELSPKGGIRLLGISGSGFEAGKEMDLFADPVADKKKEKLYDTIDSLKQRFGEKIIGKG